MIRFIDLRGQITDDRDPHFAFFDTVRDKFVNIGGEEDWHSLDDLMSLGFEGDEITKRCAGLIPSGYFLAQTDMRRLAKLAQDFYAEKQAEAGMETPIRKAWASNEEGGLLFIVSCFGVHSRELAKQTGIPWKEA